MELCTSGLACVKKGVIPTTTLDHLFITYFLAPREGEIHGQTPFPHVFEQNCKTAANAGPLFFLKKGRTWLKIYTDASSHPHLYFPLIFMYTDVVCSLGGVFEIVVFSVILWCRALRANSF